MGCFSGRLMSAASDQKLFCRLCSPFCCSFDEFVEEKVISPSYSSAILTPPPDFFDLFTEVALGQRFSFAHHGNPEYRAVPGMQKVLNHLLNNCISMYFIVFNFH